MLRARTLSFQGEVGLARSASQKLIQRRCEEMPQPKRACVSKSSVDSAVVEEQMDPQRALKAVQNCRDAPVVEGILQQRTTGWFGSISRKDYWARLDPLAGILSCWQVGN